MILEGKLENSACQSERVVYKEILLFKHELNVILPVGIQYIPIYTHLLCLQLLMPVNGWSNTPYIICSQEINYN